MTNRIQKSIDIFLDAINNGTLAKGTCTACAVGNLVAAGLNGKIEYNGEEKDVFTCTTENSRWSLLFYTVNGKQNIYDYAFHDQEVMDNIKATDFTWQELAKIEYAFETNSEIDYLEYCNYTKEEVKKDQIKGIEAVIKVMLEFDNQVDDVKEVFTKKAELIVV